MNKIIDYFLPNYTEKDKAIKNRAFFLVYALLFIVVVNIVGLLTLLKEENNSLLIAASLSLAITLFNLFYLKKTKDLYWSMIIFALNGLLFFCYTILFSGGAVSPFLVWLLIFPITPIILNNNTALVLNSVVSGALIIVLGIFEYYQIPLPTAIITVEKNRPFLLLSIFMLSVFTGVVIFFYDKNNKKYTEQLSESNKALERFAYIASHDMKEPLRNIISFSQLLKRRAKEKLTEEESEYLAIVMNSAKQLHGLVEGVLEYSKIDKDISEVLEEIDLNLLLAEIKENLRLVIREKKAKIIYNNLPKLKVAELHLVQLFQNLISNGIKYNTSLVPTVSINVETDKKYYHFLISDNGIGIPKEFQDQVFEMFKRLHTRDKYEGTGIGLAVCQKIAQRYGGSLTIDNSSENGTTFRLLLPKH